eukprot:250889-Chlamydomonas_euryale.AAC.2
MGVVLFVAISPVSLPVYLMWFWHDAAWLWSAWSHLFDFAHVAVMAMELLVHQAACVFGKVSVEHVSFVSMVLHLMPAAAWYYT